jgi:predicted AAA+ superfamily ATPase
MISCAVSHCYFDRPSSIRQNDSCQSSFHKNKPYASLEEPDLRQAAQDDPRSFLARYPDGAVLDEIQRCPSILSYLQTRVDADRRMGLYILTGSQQFGLMSGITQ